MRRSTGAMMDSATRSEAPLDDAGTAEEAWGERLSERRREKIRDGMAIDGSDQMCHVSFDSMQKSVKMMKTQIV